MVLLSLYTAGCGGYKSLSSTMMGERGMVPVCVRTEGQNSDSVRSVL